MKRILIACTVMALAACVGKDENGDGIADGVTTPDSVQQVAPSTPVGTLSGQTVKIDGSPLDGVKVTLILGDKVTSVTSSNTGAFAFKNIAAGGAGQLWFEKSGYAKILVSGGAPASTAQYYGGFPLNNGNGNLGQVGLSALSSRQQFRVVTGDGAPAVGANATLEMNGVGYVATYGAGDAYGRYTATVQVGADGLATFENTPDLLALSAAFSAMSTNGNVAFAVQALDTTGDQVADWRGSVSSWQITGFFQNDPVPLIQLSPANSTGGISIVGSNLASFAEGAGSRPFKNALKNNDPVSITFNQAINEVGAARWVKVVAEDCKTDVAVTVTQVSPWTIQIVPTAGWTLGNKYNFAVHATGLETGATSTFIGYGFGLDATQALTLNTPTFEAYKPTGTTTETGIFRPSTGDVLYVKFNTPIEDNSAGATVQFALDIDANGNTTGYGETGNMYRQGFAMQSDEQTQAVPANAGTFTCVKSGFSSRYLIPVSSGIASLPGGITSGTQARILFPLAPNSTGAYNLITGSTVQIDATQQAPITVSVSQ